MTLSTLITPMTLYLMLLVDGVGTGLACVCSVSLAVISVGLTFNLGTLWKQH